MKITKTIKTLIIGAAAFLAVLIGGIFAIRSQNLTIAQDTRIYIPRGATFSDLTDSLTVHQCIRNKTIFQSISRLRGLTNHVKAGSYVFSPGTNVVQVVQRLYSGNQTPIKLTINKYRTPQQLCAFLGQKLEFNADSLLAMMTDEAICQTYGESTQTIISIFLQNTYEVYWTITPKALMDRMKRESDQFWSSRQSQLDKMKLSRQQVITLASIVEEETNCNEEKADIASVYLNRFRIGMPLQADPTIKFALGDFTIRRIWGAMLSIDNPYNTYKYQGLPPGPICIPSTYSIDAVLKSKKTDYFFFCAKEDFSGRHNFSSTIAQHQANAQKFHKALNERNIK